MPEDKQHRTRVLIVEDEPMIAITLEDLLVEAGFGVVGVAGKLDKALALIGSAVFDVAIVDANLAGVSASPAASALMREAYLSSCCRVIQSSNCQMSFLARIS